MLLAQPLSSKSLLVSSSSFPPSDLRPSPPVHSLRPASLLSLPSEIRTQIYHHLFHQSTLPLQSWIPIGVHHPHAHLGVVAVATVSRLLRAEALPLFWRLCRVEMLDGLKLLRRLGELSGSSLRHRGRVTDAGTVPPARICYQPTAVRYDGIGLLFDTTKLQLIEIEAHRAWMNQTSFLEVAKTFPVARDVRIKCSIGEQYELAEGPWHFGSLRGKPGEMIAFIVSDRMSRGEGPMGEVVAWVEEASPTADAGMEEWWLRARVQIRMKIFATVRGMGLGCGSGVQRELGILVVEVRRGTASSGFVKRLWFEIGAERLLFECDEAKR